MSTATIAQVADVIGRATSDAAFRQQLVSSPSATLQSAGVGIPSGLEVKVLENTGSLVNLVLPPKPSGVADADLQETAAAPAPGSSVASQLDAYGRLVVATWTDADLKARLVSDPNTVLAERGINMPSNVTVRIYASSDTVSYLVLPAGGAS